MRQKQRKDKNCNWHLIISWPLGWLINHSMINNYISPSQCTGTFTIKHDPSVSFPTYVCECKCKGSLERLSCCDGIIRMRQVEERKILSTWRVPS